VLNVGPPELLLILLIALLVLGPNKLPDAARQVGRAMAELRRLSSGFQAELREAMEEPVTRSPTPLATPAPPEPDDHEAMNAALAEARDEAVAAARPARRREPLRKQAPAKAAPARKRPARKKAAATNKASAKKASAKQTPAARAGAAAKAPATKKRG
jgi:Tat protein translocase TatB subunit